MWCRARERLDTIGCTGHLLGPHIMEKETVAHCDPRIYLSHRHPFFVRPTSVWTFLTFHFKFLERRTSKSHLSLHSLSESFPWEALGFTRGLCCIFKWPFLFFLYSNRCSRYSGNVPRPPLPNKSLWNENFTPSFRWQLYVAVSSSGLPVGLWSWQHATLFDSWGTLTVLQAGQRPSGVWS